MARVRWKNRDGTENLAEGTEGEGLEAQARGRLGRNWKPRPGGGAYREVKFWKPG